MFSKKDVRVFRKTSTCFFHPFSYRKSNASSSYFYSVDKKAYSR